MIWGPLVSGVMIVFFLSWTATCHFIYKQNHVNMTIVICPRDILESVQNLLCTVTHSEPSSFLVYVRSDFDL